MSTRVVSTQKELDKAIKDGVDWVEIRSERGVWLEVTACGSSTVRAYGSSTVTAYGSSTVTAYGSSTVTAYDSSTVTAYDSSTVRAYGSSTVRACDSSTVTAYGSSTVRACDSSTVTAYGSSTVTAYDSSTVTAYDSSTVTAYDSSTVRACGSSTVRACGSSTVRAYGSSTVTAYGSSTVRAYGSSTVTAYGSSTVTAYGSSTVTAGSHTAVHLHSGRVSLTGGVVIDHAKVDLDDTGAWAAYHGVEVVDGVATVYKAVDDKYTTDRGFDYSPGATPEAPDWKSSRECGNGLHFGPTPGHALAYHPTATRFMEAKVLLADLVTLSGGTAKCKAPRVVAPLVEVTIHGEPVETVSESEDAA